MRVAVIGGGTVDADTAERAAEVGRALAVRDHAVVCGGRGGVMAAACRGAKAAGGRTIGILPGEDPRAADDAVDVPIATGLGHARNGLVVLNAAAVIAVDGAAGTCSELGFAGVYGRPVAGLATFDLPWVHAVESPTAAVAYVEDAVAAGDADE